MRAGLNNATTESIWNFDESETRSDSQNRGRVWSRRIALDLLALSDALAIVIGAIITAGFFAIAGDVPIQPGQILQSAIIAAFIANICFRANQFYDPRQIHRLPVPLGTILLSLMIAFAASFGLGLPVPLESAQMVQWYLLWLAASAGVLLVTRSAISAYLSEQALAGRFDQRIGVYGAGAIARRVHDYLDMGPAGLSFVGVYDDRSAQGCRVADNGLTIRGGLCDLIAAGRRGEIDQIIIALPQTADRRIAEISRKLEQLPVSLHVVTHMAPDLVDPVAVHKVSTLGPLGLLDVKANPQADWAPVIKRAEDLVLGTVLLALFLPLFVIISTAIKLDSAGPALFRQRRRGFNQEPIDVVKFRTMTVMENGESAVQATAEDTRVTRVGAILRRTSLDELPQLWNVVRGDMSLVGPRPHAIAHDDAWSREIARYANRAQVKPGITGLAQVYGERGPVGAGGELRRRVDRDLEYIADWSLTLDMRIIAMTTWAVIRGRNAL